MDDAAKGRDGDEEKEKEKKAENNGEHGKKVSFTGLFRYSDGVDLLLMLVGTVAALANGVSQPLMTVIFGDVIDAFGGATTGNVLQRVNKMSHAGLSISGQFPTLLEFFHGSGALLAIRNNTQKSGRVTVLDQFQFIWRKLRQILSLFVLAERWSIGRILTFGAISSCCFGSSLLCLRLPVSFLFCASREKID